MFSTGLSKSYRDDYLTIDGSMYEGGGQILRMSIAFSSLLNEPVTIQFIRWERPERGLRPQHLAEIRLVAKITRGKLEGAYIGSTEVTFYPRKIKAGKYKVIPKTAGSVPLLFQIAFPVMLFANRPSELHLLGGTNIDMGPQIDHTLNVFKPIAELFGAKFSCNIVKRGYYPRRSGEVCMQILPVTSHLTPLLRLDPGRVMDIKGYSFTIGPRELTIANHMADAAADCLSKNFPGVPVAIQRTRDDERAGNGSGIVLWAETDTGCVLGGSALLADGKRSDETGRIAAREIVDSSLSKTCVDSHVQDQIVILMALARGTSQVRIGTPTLHTKTAIYVAEKMTKARFQWMPGDDHTSMILKCEGIGLDKNTRKKVNEIDI